MFPFSFKNIYKKYIQLVGVKFEVVKYFEKYDKDSLYGYPVKWGKAVNMEAVTHSLLGPLINKVGVGAYKTLDALDFSIEHLSLYERRFVLLCIYLKTPLLLHYFLLCFFIFFICC